MSWGCGLASCPHTYLEALPAYYVDFGVGGSAGEDPLTGPFVWRLCAEKENEGEGE